MLFSYIYGDVKVGRVRFKVVKLISFVLGFFVFFVLWISFRRIVRGDSSSRGRWI